MADKKISELPTLLQNQVNITTDIIPIVTPSDTTKNKKVTVNALVNSVVSGLGLFSSSAQINALGNLSASFIEYTNIANTPTLVSASSQISYEELSNVPNGIVSSSSQIDVNNTVGITTIATTGSNIFTGIQTISDTTNSTVFTDGALIVDGGVGIAKDVNISGSLTVTGLLTAISMSTEFVTSSQYVVGDNKIILNSDDVARFGGMSIYDSGSSVATSSLYWDSFNHRFIYENLGGLAYNSAILIAGPKNTGTLGDEVGLITNRVPVASGDDHIDTALVSSSIRVDFPSRLTHVEAGLYVTGSVSSSAGFTGPLDYANITNLPTLVSASSQISYSGLTGKPAGIVSSSGQISYTGLSNTPSGIVSSSGQVAAALPTGTVSSSTQINTGSFTGSFTGTFTGATAGAFVLGSVLSPAAVSSNTHDYNPAGLSTANFLRISATTNVSLTGIQAPSPAVNQVLFVVNVGTGNINMLNNNAGSSTANRFNMNNDRLLNNGEGVILIYDTTSLGWRCVAFQV